MTVREPGPIELTAGECGERRTVPSSVVDAARGGDADAFMAIYDAYVTRLRGLAFRTLGDPDLIDDAIQDVAVKAFLGLPHFRGECAIGTWLFQITYRTCLNLQRGRGRVVPLPDVELPADDATRGSRGGRPATHRAGRRAGLSDSRSESRGLSGPGGRPGPPDGCAGPRRAPRDGRLAVVFGARRADQVPRRAATG